MMRNPCRRRKKRLFLEIEIKKVVVYRCGRYWESQLYGPHFLWKPTGEILSRLSSVEMEILCGFRFGSVKHRNVRNVSSVVTSKM